MCGDREKPWTEREIRGLAFNLENETVGGRASLELFEKREPTGQECFASLL